MKDKKNAIASSVSATAVACILSAVAGMFQLHADTMKVVNATIPPISLLINYCLTWLTVKFQTLTIPELRALSRLNGREKRIRNDLKKIDISETARKKLQKELDSIIWEKSQIGKIENIASEQNH